MTTTRLPRGWQEIKKIGDVEPVRVLVHKETGKFGTTIDGESIKQHDTLAQAEQFVKAVQEDGAVDGLIFDQRWGDGPVQLATIRVRWVGREWIRMDGTRLPHFTKVYQPDPAVQQAVTDKTAEYRALKDRLALLRDEIGEIARQVKELEAPVD